MKNKDTIIKYRPELVKTLEDIMNNIIQLYSTNQQATLYIMLKDVYKENGDIEAWKLLSDAAKCLLKDDIFCYDIFDREYRYNLNRLEFGLGDITEPSASRVTFSIYQDLAIKMKNKLDLSDFSKSEKYMVDHFFNVLLAPTRNPNIQIQPRHNACYYDESKDGSFIRDMKSSIEYIKKECAITLEIFNTKDD